jgi:nucleoside-specific outer membrane channel protein Tsx
MLIRHKIDLETELTHGSNILAFSFADVKNFDPNLNKQKWQVYIIFMALTPSWSLELLKCSKGKWCT